MKNDKLVYDYIIEQEGYVPNSGDVMKGKMACPRSSHPTL